MGSRATVTVSRRGDRPRRLPLTGLTHVQWRNLLLVVLALLYVGYTAIFVAGYGVFSSVGCDFRAFRASAQIARSVGFAQVYDLAVQTRFQLPMYIAPPDQWASPKHSPPTEALPWPYPLAFVVLFLPFSFGSLMASFLAWELVNLAVIVLYIRRLSRALRNRAGTGVAVALLLSYPVFTTFFFGQMTVILLIAFGEFVLALRREADLEAGMWLAGLLLKPQALVVVLPGLLVARRWRALKGFAIAAVGVGVLSWALGGTGSIVTNFQLLVTFTGGVSAGATKAMINWRALGVDLGFLVGLSHLWRTVLTVGGMLLTFLVAMYVYRRAGSERGDRLGVVLLATYAATCCVAWHSHSHMALPVFAPMLYVSANGVLPQRLLTAWVVIPGLVFFVMALLVGPGGSSVFVGMCMLLFNLLLLGWSVRALRRPDPDAQLCSMPA